MSRRILDAGGLSALFAALGRGREVLVPALRRGRGVWVGAGSLAEADLGLANTALSPRHVFLPQSETLLRFPVGISGLPGPVEAAAGPERGLVLFGVRPCDAQALVLLDGILGQDPARPDPSWAPRRAGALLVGQACLEPCPGCFCSSVGGGPFGTEGLDLLVTDLGGSWMVDTVSGAGERAMQGLSGEDARAVAGTEPGKKDLARFGELEAKARAALAGDPAGVLGLPDPGAVRERTLADPERAGLAGPDSPGLLDICGLDMWERLAETCLNCGACTFCCPTCHCFDLQDEVAAGQGRRVRVWDTCMSALFTRHASGHNPRGRKADRVRQRFMHKFSYIPMKNGRIGCVGCGRCVRLCPVNIDVRRVARDMFAPAPVGQEGQP